VQGIAHLTFGDETKDTHPLQQGRYVSTWWLNTNISISEKYCVLRPLLKTMISVIQPEPLFIVRNTHKAMPEMGFSLLKFRVRTWCNISLPVPMSNNMTRFYQSCRRNNRTSNRWSTREDHPCSTFYSKPTSSSLLVTGNEKLQIL